MTVQGPPPTFGERARRATTRRFPELSPDTIELGVQLTRAAHAHEMLSERAIHRHDRRTWVSFRLLYVLWVNDSLSASELARFLHLSRQTVSNTLRALEQDGLIVRAKDAHDARMMSIRLTDAGVQSIESAVLAQFRLDEISFDVLTLEECRLLAALLERIRARMVQLKVEATDLERLTSVPSPRAT